MTHKYMVENCGVVEPELMDKLSKEWSVPKDCMFIGSLGNRYPYRTADVGGARLMI